MKYLEAPNYDDKDYGSPKIFLAGGITGCPDWQKKMRKLLEQLPRGIMYNPRRAKFNVKDSSQTDIQIRWEFDHLNKADVVIFWFCKDTLQPITLLEFGARIMHDHLSFYGDDMFPPSPLILVGIEKGYEREKDVVVQYKLATGKDLYVHRSLESLYQCLAQTLYGAFA